MNDSLASFPTTSWIGNPSVPFSSAAQLPVPGSRLEGIIKPVSIGNVKLLNNLVLAPMAGVTDGSFRLLCARMGAGYSVSELASAKALTMKSPQTVDMIRFDENTGPYAVQIFGSEPDTMAEAAAFVESLNICNIIDINMGCPVAKFDLFTNENYPFLIFSITACWRAQNEINRRAACCFVASSLYCFNKDWIAARSSSPRVLSCACITSFPLINFTAFTILRFEFTSMFHVFVIGERNLSSK